MLLGLFATNYFAPHHSPQNYSLKDSKLLLFPPPCSLQSLRLHYLSPRIPPFRSYVRERYPFQDENFVSASALISNESSKTTNLPTVPFALYQKK